MNTMDRWLFIDTSYFVFYRYFAVYQWLRRFKPDEVIDTTRILENPAFIEKYAKTFEKTILDLMKKFKIHGQNVVFAKDCPRDCIWRMQHYPLYKATREDKSDTFNKEIFRYTYATLLPELASTHGFKDLEFDGLEADDIIALSVRKICKETPQSVVVVVTNDNDYVQLLEYDIILINLQQKMLQDRIDNPCTYLSRKVIMGDKSDNIPAIMKKCGEKTAERLIQDPIAMEKALQNPDTKRQYDLNKLLIDFTYIPQDKCVGFYEYMPHVVKLLKE